MVWMAPIFRGASLRVAGSMVEAKNGIFHQRNDLPLVPLSSNFRGAVPVESLCSSPWMSFMMQSWHALPSPGGRTPLRVIMTSSTWHAPCTEMKRPARPERSVAAAGGRQNPAADEGGGGRGRPAGMSPRTTPPVSSCPLGVARRQRTRPLPLPYCRPDPSGNAILGTIEAGASRDRHHKARARIRFLE